MANLLASSAHISRAKGHRPPPHPHQWVTVVNPNNHRSLLQACDNCGVVKSENSVIHACKKPQGQHLITDSIAAAFEVSA